MLLGELLHSRQLLLVTKKLGPRPMDEDIVPHAVTATVARARMASGRRMVDSLGKRAPVWPLASLPRSGKVPRKPAEYSRWPDRGP